MTASGSVVFATDRVAEIDQALPRFGSVVRGDSLYLRVTGSS